MNYITTKLASKSFWIVEKETPFFFMGKSGAKQLLDALHFVLQSKENCCALKLLQNEMDTPEMLTQRIEYGQYTIVFAYHYQHLAAKKVKQLASQSIECNHIPMKKTVNDKLVHALRYQYKNIKDKIDLDINGNIIIFSGSVDVFNILYNEVLEFYENAYDDPKAGLYHYHLNSLLTQSDKHDFTIFYYENDPN